MTPLKHSQNFAARMGRWSAGHWKTAVVSWFAFVVLALFMGMQVGTKSIDPNDSNVGEARTADHIINDAGFNLDKNGENIEEQGEMVLFQSTSKASTVKDPAFRAAIADAEKTLAKFKQVTNLRSPLDPGEADLISKDGRSAMIQFTPTGTYEEAGLYIDKLVKAVDTVESRHPGFLIDETGSVSTGTAVDTAVQGGLKKAGLVSIPLTIIILLIVLGSLVAALIPLLLGITSVIATMGLIAFASQVVPMSEDIMEVVLLIGLAVGVDYALFYIRREREERRAGRSEGAALEAAAATSGRAVLVSGMTVLIAMAGMIFSGDQDFKSFAVGTMIVVAVAMLGSLTVLPAVLSKLGDRVEKGRIPFVHRLRRHKGESRVWGAVLDRVLRRPLVSAVAATAVLVALAVPALGMHTTETGTEGISMAAIEPFERLIDAFPGSPEPAIVAINADDVNAAPVRDAIADLKREALASGQMNAPIDVTTNPDGTVTKVEIPLEGKGNDDASNAALATLRGTLLPDTIGQVDGVEYAVTGQTAASQDYNEAQARSLPLVFAFVLLFAFGLLLVTFRSIVIALKAIVLNLLSVAAAYGVIVAIFQWGWGENLLDFQSNGGIANWLPVFLFVILFGLSMDYHVFILSRIREAYDRGLSNDNAIAYGIKSTAGTVTSAAVVMVGVFSVFTLLPVIDFKEMGIGLAVAVLIDATLVRGVLLPASMKLLGNANWYLPKWLQWLPRLEHEPAPPAPQADPAPAAA
jgi:RND superfamily putative drug exporter